MPLISSSPMRVSAHRSRWRMVITSFTILVLSSSVTDGGSLSFALNSRASRGVAVGQRVSSCIT
eukprot:348285-Hanusia_phi.AAC.1